MKALIVLSLCLLFSTFGSTACKKEEVNNDSDTSRVFLGNKSLSEVKSALKGSWKIHYMYGGFNGRMKQDLQDSYFRFLPNDSVYIIFSNQSNTADKATFVRKNTIYNYTAWSIEYTLLNGIKHELIVDHMIKDTLALSDNMPDSYVYFMTKIQ